MGAELLTLQDLHLEPGTFWETWLSVNGNSIVNSVGRDEYPAGLLARKGTRLAATGRANVHAGGPLETTEAPPSRPIALPMQADSIWFHFRTNAYGDKALAVPRLLIRITAVTRSSCLEMRRAPAVGWLYGGRCAVNVTPLITRR